MQALIVIGILVVSQVKVLPEGYFYAVPPIDQDDRLYRLDWEGTATPVGEEGALGWPAVTRIAWEPETGRLYGFDSQFSAWLSIDPITGRAVRVSDGALQSVHQLLRA